MVKCSSCSVPEAEADNRTDCMGPFAEFSNVVKAAITNMFKEGKETLFKEIRQIRIKMS